MTVNLEQAKEFRKLGFLHKTDKYWFPNPNLPETIIKHGLNDYILVDKYFQLAEFDNVENSIHNLQRTYPAYNIEELFSIIDDEIFTNDEINLNLYFYCDRNITFTEWLAEELLNILKHENI